MVRVHIWRCTVANGSECQLSSKCGSGILAESAPNLWMARVIVCQVLISPFWATSAVLRHRRRHQNAVLEASSHEGDWVGKSSEGQVVVSSMWYDKSTSEAAFFHAKAHNALPRGHHAGADACLLPRLSVRVHRSWRLECSWRVPRSSAC